MIEIVMIKNKGMTVRLPRLSVVAWAFLMSCMGCITNSYEKFYDISDFHKERFLKDVDVEIIKE